MTPLAGGDMLVLGRFDEDDQLRWELGRMNPSWEFVWTRDIYATDSGEVQRAFVNGNHVLLMTSEREYIDSHSWTTRRNYVCYTLDGDSMWANSLEDSVNYTSMSNAVGMDDGGFLVYGQESYLDSIFIRYHEKLVKLDTTGTVVWERIFDGENYSSGDIAKLSQDSVLIASVFYSSEPTDIRFSFLDSDGNVGRTLQFESNARFSNTFGTRLILSEYGFDFVWSSDSEMNLGTRLQLIRIDSTGAVQLSTSGEESVNRLRTVVPVEGGLLTFGGPDFNMPTGIHVGHLGANHVWYYMEHYPFEVSAPVYGMLPGASPTCLGALRVEATTWHPTIFYFSPEGPASYLYSTPDQLNCGIVPLEETNELTLELALTGQTPVTVTEFIVPQNYAISAQAPITIQPDEEITMRLAFRPTERRHFVDTLYLVSSALNDTIFVPITGEAPYPLCEPDRDHLDLRWCVIGDTVSADLHISNTGTEPLHIAAMNQPSPFWLENTGPFLLPADSSLTLTLFAAPINVGIHDGLLVIQSDEPNSPDSIALTVRVVSSPSSAEEEPKLPTEFKLHPPYPNPFNASTVIRFELPKTELVKLDLFDITGRLVQEIARQTFDAGEHRIAIDGAELASGIYFAVMNTGDDYAVQKLLLVR